MDGRYHALQRVHQSSQCRGLILTTGVIHKEAGNRRCPILQDTDKPLLGNVLCNLLFIDETEARSSERRLNHQVRVVDDKRAVHANRD